LRQKVQKIKTSKRLNTCDKKDEIGSNEINMLSISPKIKERKKRRARLPAPKEKGKNLYKDKQTQSS